MQIGRITNEKKRENYPNYRPSKKTVLWFHHHLAVQILFHHQVSTERSILVFWISSNRAESTVTQSYQKLHFIVHLGMTSPSKALPVNLNFHFKKDQSGQQRWSKRAGPEETFVDRTLGSRPFKYQKNTDLGNPLPTLLSLHIVIDFLFLSF
jgi:hypothetical protein